MARILVVEDEKAMRQGIRDLLAFHGHAPDTEADGAAGLARALTGAYDLVVLDVMMPRKSGFEVCRELRSARPGLAILLLTALGQQEHVLTGFEAGCDDYLAKPFAMPVFVARVKALLRRAGADERSTKRIGAATFDDANYRLVGDDGNSCELTAREAAVLNYFFSNRGRVIERLDLLRDVWDYENPDAIETRCVDMHIANLRRKLAKTAADGAIETVRGAGYRLAMEV